MSAPEPDAAPKDLTLSVRFNAQTLTALRNLRRDFFVAAAVNAVPFAANLTWVTGFANDLSGKFGLCALGTAVTAAGIAAGRYLGGAGGALIDAMRGNKDGRCRQSLATVGGSLSGVAAWTAYHSGLWALGMGGP